MEGLGRKESSEDCYACGQNDWRADSNNFLKWEDAREQV